MDPTFLRKVVKTPDYHRHSNINLCLSLPAIDPVSSFLSLLTHEAELESWERLELAVTSLLLEQCLLSLGWQQTGGLAEIIFRLAS